MYTLLIRKGCQIPIAYQLVIRIHYHFTNFKLLLNNINIVQYTVEQAVNICKV